jgi:chromosome partitioning protein
MIVVAVVNSKGGVGKTTLTATLGVRAAKDSPRVALVDLDPQQSLHDWWASRGQGDNPTMFTGAKYADDAVEALRRDGWDWVFLDGPPSGLTTIEDMVHAADLVLIPIKPSGLDFKASHDVVVMAREANIPMLVVFNDIVSSDHRRVSESRLFLEREGLALAKQQITHRSSHISAMNVGKSAAEVNGGRDKEATEEIEALWAEVKKAARAAARQKTRAA